MDDQIPEDEPALLSAAEVAAAFGFALLATFAVLLVAPLLAAATTGILALLMALVTLTDARHFLIPDRYSLSAIPLGMMANLLVFHPGDWAAGLTESALGAVLAAGSFYLLRALWFALRGVEGLGLGDVKLAGAAGAWLGPTLLAPACLAAALAGLVAVAVMTLVPGRRLGLADHIPFGSFIAPVILLFWVLRLLAIVQIW